jgi:hypothetical protein
MITVNTKKTRKSLSNFLEQLEKTIIVSEKVAGNFLESEIKDPFPVNSADARNDIDTKLIQNKDGKVITRVGSNEINYTYWIEFGRKAGKYPNFNSISKWLARLKDLQEDMFNEFFPKPSEPREGVDYSFHPILVRNDFDDLNYKQKSLVFAIAGGIKKKGYKGKFLFKKARDNHGEKAQQIVIDRVTKLINSY